MIEQMKLIMRPPGAGKTTRLVEIAMCDPRAIIITYSEREADRIRGHYQELNPRQVMTWREYASQRGIHSRTRPMVDNIDLVLNDVLGTWVDTGTLLTQQTDKQSMSMSHGITFVRAGRENLTIDSKGIVKKNNVRKQSNRNR